MAMSPISVRDVVAGTRPAAARRSAVSPTAAPVGGRAAGRERTGSARPIAAGAMARALIAAQESERRRLAHELHDVVGQALTAVRLNLESLARDGLPDSGRLRECLSTVDEALQQVRGFALELGPALLDDHGLAAAVRALLARSARDARITVSFEADPIPQRDPAFESTAYRIVQEALTNIVRHAGAMTVAVRLSATTDALELSILDDGRGFGVADALARARAGASLGLPGMYERVRLLGGELHVISAPGRGTLVRARFPWPGHEPDLAVAER